MDVQKRIDICHNCHYYRIWARWPEWQAIWSERYVVACPRSLYSPGRSIHSEAHSMDERLNSYIRCQLLVHFIAWTSVLNSPTIQSSRWQSLNLNKWIPATFKDSLGRSQDSVLWFTACRSSVRFLEESQSYIGFIKSIDSIRYSTKRHTIRQV